MKSKRTFLQGLCLAVIAVCLVTASSADAQTPSAGWTSVDIGNVLQGSTGPASNGFSVTAAGSDIWDLTDEFRFVYRPLTGNGVIVARVEHWNYTEAWSKAGVMIRESLATNSKHAFMLLSGTGGPAFQRRTTTGGWTTHTAGAWSTDPVWVRLERSDSTITASQSNDGVNWTTVGSDTISMSGTVYIGLALTSHTPLAYATADFTNVTVSASLDWTSYDIAVAIGGWTSRTSDGYSVIASGRDIWDDSDAFRFVYRQLTGDGVIVARVATLNYADDWSKAGVMIRETLAQNSKHASMFVSGTQGMAFQRRVFTGGWTDHTFGGWGTLPQWVRLERRGSTVTAFQSSDGTNWTTVGSDSVSMGSTIYIGLALTSHSPLSTASADFTNISVTESSAGTSWTSADVGSVALAGSTSLGNPAISVKAAGSDVWGASDEFRFVYQPLVGDGAIVARVDSLNYTDTWSKSGVMIRETLAANSKHAFMLLSGTAGLAFQRRASTGGSTLHTAGAWSAAPAWVRLQRQGSTITASHSSDGANWTTVGTQSISMASTVYAGLALTSHTALGYATADFTNVTINAGGSSVLGNQSPLVSLTSPAYGASFVAPATIALTADASDPDGGIAGVDFYAGATLIGSDSSSPYSVTWSGVPAGSYSLTAVAKDLSGAVTASSERIIWVNDSAQPRQAVFMASSNHATAVSHYVLDVFPAGADPNASNPVAGQDLGLPAVVNGECRADITQLMAGLPPGTYVATVTAIGDGGSARSAPSAPFSR
jgi:regulation of enolase protein 1 (concanavalin A-like superfamily)